MTAQLIINPDLHLHPSINIAHPLLLHSPINKNSFILVGKSRGRVCNGFLVLLGNPRAQKFAEHLQKKIGKKINRLLQQSTLNVVARVMHCSSSFAFVCTFFPFLFSPPNLLLFAVFAIWPLKRSPVELLPQPLLTPGEQTAIMGN